jgi:cyanophycinase
MTAPQPIYLLADSQLLFWEDARRGGSLLLEELACRGVPRSPHAAYIGASNGDAPESYEIFEAAEQPVVDRSQPIGGLNPHMG